MPLNLEKLSGDEYKLKYKSSRRVISETCVKHNPIDVTQVDSFLIMKHYLMDYIRCSLNTLFDGLHTMLINILYGNLEKDNCS